MDINVEKFQKDLKRFCKSYPGCDGCPLKKLANGCYRIDCLTEVIPVVQKWAEEHPTKTYLMDFKDKFPNSMFDDTENYFCLKYFYGKDAMPCKCSNCEDCWNREME